MTVEIFEKDRAFHYDRFIETWMPNYYIALESAFQILKNKMGTTGDLLVAGCGTGNEIKVFKEHAIQWQITGVDPSRDMVNIAQEKLRDYTDIAIIEGEVSQLIYSEFFDAATLILVLHFIPDNGEKLKLLKHIANRINTGAPFVLIDIFGTKAEMRLKLRQLKNSLPLMITAQWEDVEARLDRIYNEIHYIPEQRLFELLEEAGFKDPIRFHQSTLYGGWACIKA